ncbi:MAG: hypothetical protein J7647_19670 [Cyanobacteria bacterium SBLK]|nr:hypothetical protein [Cyanobacteria bacterium SBLK]
MPKLENRPEKLNSNNSLEKLILEQNSVFVRALSLSESSPIYNLNQDSGNTTRITSPINPQTLAPMEVSTRKEIDSRNIRNFVNNKNNRIERQTLTQDIEHIVAKMNKNQNLIKTKDNRVEKKSLTEEIDLIVAEMNKNQSFRLTQESRSEKRDLTQEFEQIVPDIINNLQENRYERKDRTSKSLQENRSEKQHSIPFSFAQLRQSYSLPNNLSEREIGKRLVQEGITQIKRDSMAYSQKKFPRNYYETFAKNLFEKSLSLTNNDYGYSFDLLNHLAVGEDHILTNLSLGKNFKTQRSQLVEAYTSNVGTDNPSGWDKFMHFTFTAKLQYKSNGFLAPEIFTYGKEAWDQVEKIYTDLSIGFELSFSTRDIVEGITGVWNSKIPNERYLLQLSLPLPNLGIYDREGWSHPDIIADRKGEEFAEVMAEREKFEKDFLGAWGSDRYGLGLNDSYEGTKDYQNDFHLGLDIDLYDFDLDNSNHQGSDRLDRTEENRDLNQNHESNRKETDKTTEMQVNETSDSTNNNSDSNEDSDRGDRSEGGGDDGGGDWCYITTAVCISTGLGDDCELLQILREYRDNYLAKRPGGQKEIELYYDLAPSIVKKINLLPNRSAIWQQTLVKYILPAVNAIQCGLPETAYCIYKEMVDEIQSYS